MFFGIGIGNMLCVISAIYDPILQDDRSILYEYLKIWYWYVQYRNWRYLKFWNIAILTWLDAQSLVFDADRR